MRTDIVFGAQYTPPPPPRCRICDAIMVPDLVDPVICAACRNKRALRALDNRIGFVEDGLNDAKQKVVEYQNELESLRQKRAAYEPKPETRKG